MHALRFRPARIVVALALLAGLTAAPARADVAGTAAAWLDRSLSVAGIIASGTRDTAVAIWHAAASFVLPAAPFDHMPDRASAQEVAFIGVMEEAGYQLAGVTTGGGLLPEVSYRFVLVREPTEDSAARAARAMERHQETHSGPVAIAQRRIVAAVLDLPAQDPFLITAVVVGIRPWPWVRYEMTRRDTAIEAGERPAPRPTN